MKVILLAALTADGYIGRTADHLADWTSREDKRLFVRLTKEAGAFVMGSRTFATIGKLLPERRNIIYTRHPETITVEGAETTSEAPQELIIRLQQEGAPGLAVCGGASIYSLFMQAGVVDELYLTVAPKLFGEGVRLLNQSLDVGLKLLEMKQLDEDTALLHYAVQKG